MKRFRTEVKLFAINEHSQGKNWPTISRLIQEKFKLEPPTTRAMQKWEETLDREAINAEITKDIKAQMPISARQAQIQLIQNAIPVLSEASETGQNVEKALWRWFFQWVESVVGREKFKSLMQEYFAETGTYSESGEIPKSATAKSE
jgi:hypothetical protein